MAFSKPMKLALEGFLLPFCTTLLLLGVVMVIPVFTGTSDEKEVLGAFPSILIASPLG